jgi:hypothetical protein
MGMISSIQVPCPECDEPIAVGIDIVSQVDEGDDALQVRMKPDVSAMVEHYAAEHVGADVDDHG